MYAAGSGYLSVSDVIGHPLPQAGLVEAGVMLAAFVAGLAYTHAAAASGASIINSNMPVWNRARRWSKCGSCANGS